MDSITRSLALEWGAYGIRVNGVAPGPIAGTAGRVSSLRIAIVVLLVKDVGGLVAVTIMGLLL